MQPIYKAGRQIYGQPTKGPSDREKSGINDFHISPNDFDRVHITTTKVTKTRQPSSTQILVATEKQHL
jgi:hypothetical protein